MVSHEVSCCYCGWEGDADDCLYHNGMCCPICYSNELFFGVHSLQEEEADEAEYELITLEDEDEDDWEDELEKDESWVDMREMTTDIYQIPIEEVEEVEDTIEYLLEQEYLKEDDDNGYYVEDFDIEEYFYF